MISGAKELQDKVCKLDVLFDQQVKRLEAGELTHIQFQHNALHIIEKQQKLTSEIAKIRIDEFKNDKL